MFATILTHAKLLGCIAAVSGGAACVTPAVVAHFRQTPGEHRGPNDQVAMRDGDHQRDSRHNWNDQGDRGDQGARKGHDRSLHVDWQLHGNFNQRR